MVSSVEIVPANLRDVTWIGANMRAADLEEIVCQVPEGMSGSAIAHLLFEGMLVDWSWVATYKGQPTTCFGVTPHNVATWSGFAFGTNDMVRTIPAVSAFILGLEDRLIAAGVRRVEVRTIDTHDISHQWLRKLGCWFEAEMHHYGRNGETFELWAWHVGQPPSRSAKWKPRHVLSQTQDAQTASPAAPGGAQER
jgi:hypothetical protein